MSSGYSGTPLAKKLGFKSGYRYLLCNEPDFYFDLFPELPDDIIKLNSLTKESADFIHIFCHDLRAFEETFIPHKVALKKNGTMWISWPIKSSTIKTDIDGNKVRSYILENGLVDVKVAAIDETWSALKAVYRTKDR